MRYNHSTMKGRCDYPMLTLRKQRQNIERKRFSKPLFFFCDKITRFQVKLFTRLAPRNYLRNLWTKFKVFIFLQILQDIFKINFSLFFLNSCMKHINAVSRPLVLDYFSIERFSPDELNKSFLMSLSFFEFFRQRMITTIIYSPGLLTPNESSFQF